MAWVNGEPKIVFKVGKQYWFSHRRIRSEIQRGRWGIITVVEFKLNFCSKRPSERTLIAIALIRAGSYSGCYCWWTCWALTIRLLDADGLNKDSLLLSLRWRLFSHRTYKFKFHPSGRIACIMETPQRWLNPLSWPVRLPITSEIASDRNMCEYKYVRKWPPKLDFVWPWQFVFVCDCVGVGREATKIIFICR